MYSRGAKHPYLVVYNTDHSGGLAVRHREIATEAVERSERYVYGRFYTVTLYALPTVFWTQIRGYLISSLQGDRVNVITHVYSI